MIDPSEGGRTAMTRRACLAAVLVAVLAAAAVAAPSMIAADTRPFASESRSAGEAQVRSGWVASWAAMPQLTEPGNMPPAPFTQPGRVLGDATLRQTVHASIGGRQMRLRFSNAFGGAALPITRSRWRCRPAGGPASARSRRAAAGR